MRDCLRRSAALSLCLIFFSISLAACGNSNPGGTTSFSSTAPPSAVAPQATLAPTPAPTPVPTPVRDNTPVVLENTAPGSVTYGNSAVTIDASNTADGYFMARYEGSNQKVKLVLDGPDGRQYRFDMNNTWQAFPLAAGSGSYTLGVYENVYDTSYTQAYSVSFDAAVTDEFTAFLRPNEYVDYTADSVAVQKGAELAEGAQSDLEVVERVYDFVMEHLAYDYDKADNVKSGYLPNVDDIMASGTGICFDYASLMATMLRSQRIPTRLDIGWSGDIYHAWVSVYLAESGWVNGIIQFDGTEWKRMDPTFADNGNQEDWIMEYIEKDSNYNTLLVY